MRFYIAPLATLVLFCASLALAQEGKSGESIPGQERAPAISPEMYAHLQELRRYDSPKENAIRAAMVKAEQRRARLAAQQWYGYSNLRPTVNPIPFMGSYSPQWAGNGVNENYWYDANYTSTWNNYTPGWNYNARFVTYAR